MERELRRYQNLLVCVGSGIILFGLWTLVKGVMTIILYKEELQEFLLSLGTREEELALMIELVSYFLIILCCLDLALRLAVGLSARREGRARDQKRHWLIAREDGGADGLLTLTLTSLTMDLKDFNENFNSIFDGIITVAIDATSVVMIIELFVAGAKVKYLKKKIREAKVEEVAA